MKEVPLDPLEGNQHILLFACCVVLRCPQEKEKDTKKLSLMSSTPWSLVLVSLLHLVSAEKTYFSLSFLVTPKKFFRKDVSSYCVCVIVLLCLFTLLCYCIYCVKLCLLCLLCYCVYCVI